MKFDSHDFRFLFSQVKEYFKYLWYEIVVLVILFSFVLSFVFLFCFYSVIFRQVFFVFPSNFISSFSFYSLSRIFHKWFFSTNINIFGTLYLFFAILAGVFGTSLSLLIRHELLAPGHHYFAGNSQLYNVVITAHALIMIFFMVMLLLYVVLVIFLFLYLLVHLIWLFLD